MKISNLSLPLLFATSILLLGCSKDENPLISQEDMWNCHHEMTWDSLKINNTLLGEWEWEFVKCFWNPGGDEEFEGLTIEFKIDNTLNVRENGLITQTSNWQVVDGDVNLFAVEVDPRVDQLYGRILFCDDGVEFNDSYIDGCDNYFKRK